MAEKSTIARPYAEAVFQLAKQQGDLKGWSDMLQLAAAIAASSEMSNVIGNPKISKEQLSELFFAVCGDQLNAAGKNFIRVLAENDRIDVLPEIATLYEEARAEEEGSVEAEVVSAQPISDAQKAAIADALKQRLGRDVSLDCKVDESLLGGAVIRAGDLVIDGSAVGRLTKLTSSLLH